MKLSHQIVDYCNKFFIYRLMANQVHKFVALRNPKAEMNRCYVKCFGKSANFDNPQDLIEKIFWLQLHTDTSLWTTCADKYLVRDYVSGLGLDKYLIKLYGVWDKPEDIDFSSLPQKYILKTNNSTGTCHIVTDSAKVDKKQIVKSLKRDLSIQLGYKCAQFHYTHIKPKIIAEELLKEASAFSPDSLVDYKVWCFHGIPEAIFLCYNRTKHSVKIRQYDLNWNDISDNITPFPHYLYDPNDNIPKPACFEEMLDVARKLSQPFPQVRVDFYVIDGKLKFGELTFTSGFGFYTQEYYRYLGSKIDLSKVKVRS